MTVAPLNLVALQTIMAADIRHALAYLGGREADPPSEKLYHLCALDHLEPSSSHATFVNRKEALVDFLTSLVIEGLVLWRSKFGLSNLPADPTPAESRQIITIHGRKRNPWLIGYTYLHFMYLRSDIGISEREFVKLCGISTVAMHECNEKAVSQLLQRIMVEELSWRAARLRN